MRWIDGIGARLGQLLCRAAAEERMDEEIRFHIEMETEKNVRAGMSRHEARRRAMVAFGGLEQRREEMREGRRFSPLGDLWRDTRFAVRSLRKRPGFSFIAASTLALGIGAATAMFSVADSVLVKPLPITDQDRVLLMERRAAGGASLFPFVVADFEAFQERTHALQDVAGVQYDGAFPRPILEDGEASNVMFAAVSSGFFRVLGARPAAGRLFVHSDDEVGAAPVVVISHELWQRRYGGDPGAVDRDLRVVGFERPIRIVGVAPQGFEFPAGVEMWYAYPIPPEMVENRFGVFSVVARLRTGVTREQAEDEARAFLRERERTAFLPHEPRGHRVVAIPLEQAIVGDVRPAMLILSAAVGLVLLLASANVANLLLVRGVRRGREISVRAALGASRTRIVQQLLAESAVLSALGAVLGIGLAYLLLHGLLAFSPPDLPRLEAARLDMRALGFALVTAAAATFVSGMAPVWWSARADLQGALRSAAPAGTESRSIRFVKQTLVILQIALAVIVLAGAGLLIRTLWNLQHAEMGFAARELTVVQIAHPRPAHRPGNREIVLGFYDRLVERVEAIPGVSAATPLILYPFSGEGGWNTIYAAQGQGEAEAAENPGLNLEAVEPGYFETFGMPILRGRAFSEADSEGSLPVAIVSESLSRRAWPAESPIGKRLKTASPGSDEPWITVVGVVPDVRYRDLVDAPPTLYLPLRQTAPLAPGFLAVRTEPGAPDVHAGVRSAVQEVERAARVLDISTFRDLMREPLAQPRFNAWLLSLLATVSLVLAGVGLFGVMTTVVTQRSRELGIRLALGASRGAVRRLVLGQGMTLLAIGGAAGLIATLLLTRLLSSVLFEVRPADPITLTIVLAVLAGTTILACYLPARRAARTDLVTALRQD